MVRYYDEAREVYDGLLNGRRRSINSTVDSLCARAGAAGSWRRPMRCPRLRRSEYWPEHHSPIRAASKSLCNARVEFFDFNYFFMRKLWFARLARALRGFPGWFQAPLMNCRRSSRLAQTKKIGSRIPRSVVRQRLLREIINFEDLFKYGMITAADLELMDFVDEPESVMNRLRRIHVDDRARMKPPPSPVRGRAEKANRRRQVPGPRHRDSPALGLASTFGCRRRNKSQFPPRDKSERSAGWSPWPSSS